MSKPNDLVQGTLDLLLLKILALQPLHGWAISLRLRSISGDVLQVSEGSLYPALHRLERRGWLVSKWESADGKREFKYYRLSAAGRKQLAVEESKWKRLVRAIARVAAQAES